MEKALFCLSLTIDIVGSRAHALPPLVQNFFIFMQFSGKIGQIIGWRSHGVGASPLENPGSATDRQRRTLSTKLIYFYDEKNKV